MEPIKLIIAIVLTGIAAYLMGSCNSAIIVSRLWKHQDIRTLGSKNAGLTNMLRVFGKGPAAATLIGDLAKGVLGVLVGQLIFRLMGAGIPTLSGDASQMYLDTRFVGYIAGIFAIVGHIFPIYYRFQGGKGVLVSCSILLVIDPVTFAIIIPFFLLVVLISGYVSVGSIVAAAAYPVITGLSQSFRGVPNVPLHVILVICTSILLIWMHRSNIKRLLEGTENKFSFKSKSRGMGSKK